MDKKKRKNVVREVYLVIPVIFYLFLSVTHRHIVFVDFFLASAVIAALCAIKRKDILAVMDNKMESIRNPSRDYAYAHITASLFIIFATLLNTIVTTIASLFYTYTMAPRISIMIFVPLIVFDALLLFCSAYGIILIPAHMRSALLFLREIRLAGVKKANKLSIRQ